MCHWAEILLCTISSFFIKALNFFSWVSWCEIPLAFQLTYNYITIKPNEMKNQNRFNRCQGMQNDWMKELRATNVSKILCSWWFLNGVCLIIYIISIEPVPKTFLPQIRPPMNSNITSFLWRKFSDIHTLLGSGPMTHFVELPDLFSRMTQ